MGTEWMDHATRVTMPLEGVMALAVGVMVMALFGLGLLVIEEWLTKKKKR